MGTKKTERFQHEVFHKYLILQNNDRYILGTIRDDVHITHYRTPKEHKYRKLKQKEYTNYAVLLVAEKWILVKETKS